MGKGYTRSKYGNKKCEYLGLKFDSIGERDRYICLLQEQEDGIITDLLRQVKFSLDINGHHICNYIADYTYYDKTGYVVEDWKGIQTDVFKLKSNLMRAIHGIELKITSDRNGGKWQSYK